MSSLIENRISSSFLFEDIHIYAHPSLLASSSSSSPSFEIDNTIVADSLPSDGPDAVVYQGQKRHIQHSAVVNYTPACRRESGGLMVSLISNPLSCTASVMSESPV